MDKTRAEIQVELGAPPGPEKAVRLAGLRQLERRLKFELIGQQPPDPPPMPPRVQAPPPAKMEAVPPENWESTVLKLAAQMREAVG